MKQLSHVAMILLSLVAPVLAQWQMDTSHPQLNVFEHHEVATLDIQWVGKDAIPHSTPSLGLFDERGNKLVDLPMKPLTQKAASIKLPTDKLGYFEIRTSGDHSQQIIPALGSRPAGMMTYAVVAKIKPDPSVNWKYDFLGIQGTTILGNGQPLGWDMYPYLGIQAAGVGYQWARMEPTGPDDFERIAQQDKAPQVIREMGIVPNFQISSFPLWALDVQRLPENQRTRRSSTRLPPKNWGEYEAYLRRIVPHIVSNYSQLPQRTYEILWEPCIPWGWYGTEEEIVKVFEVAHRVIHELDPLGRVAGPTLSSLNDTEYLEKLLIKGMAQYLDVITCHPYKGYPPEKTAIGQGLDRVMQIAQKYAGRPLSFMGTEYGFTDEVCGGSLNHSYGITTSLLIFKGEGAATHTIFYLADYAGEPGYGFMYNLVPGLPFGPKKISPKPAIPMIRAAIDQIGTSKVVGKLDYLGSDLWGYIFEDQETSELLAAIWDASDQDRSLIFDTGMPRVTVFDAMGNAQRTDTRNGLLNLSLGRVPVYIRGISPQLYGSDRLKPLLDTPENWAVARGQTLAVEVALTRDLTQEPVTLIFDTDSQVSDQQFRSTFMMQVGQPVKLSLPIARNAPLGPAVGYLRLVAGGKTIWRGIQHMEITPELSFGRIAAQPHGNTWQITQAVQNVSDAPWMGQVTTHVDGKVVAQQSMTIQAQQSMPLTMALPTGITPTQVHRVQSVFESRMGTRLVAQGDVTNFVIQPVKSLEPWEQLQPIHVASSTPELWKEHPDTVCQGDADLSASFAYGYDNEFVYVQARVTDNVHRCQMRAGTTWCHDSLQLAFDVLPSRQVNSNLLAETHERTNSEWCLALTERGLEMYAHVLPGGSKFSTGLFEQGSATNWSISRKGTMTTYRLRIAWNLLDPLHQRQGHVLGIAAAVNDSDAASKFSDRKALPLFGGILRGKDRRAFGQAVLGTHDLTP